jgi:hypothetical protein
MSINKSKLASYSEVIINRGVLIFRGFRGSLKLRKLKSNKIQLSH